MAEQEVNTSLARSTSNLRQNSSRQVSTEPSDTVSPRKFRAQDFKFGKEIGEGTFSTVYAVQEISTGAEYAIKVCLKSQMARNTQLANAIYTEKEALNRLSSHRLIVGLMATFHDSTNLYFVLTLCKRGEILTYLRSLTSFDVCCARFYTAEVLLALEYLHTQGVIHRDLKPENILLDENMHVKLADFGSAFIKDRWNRNPLYTGTPEYASPEMIQINKDTVQDYPMDLWALGCVLYQFLAGKPPFRGRNEYEKMQAALELRYQMPDNFFAPAADLVRHLLVLNPEDRLGSVKSGGYAALKAHGFFAEGNIDWVNLCDSEPPPLLPNVEPLVPLDWETVPVGYEAGVMHGLTESLWSHSADEERRAAYVREQERTNAYHRFVRQQPIVKQGILYKRRGLFARKRMFLLTDGPHLFYVDPDSMELKGEVPFSSSMKFDMKNNRLFSLLIPGRTFYLEDPQGNAKQWLDSIYDMKSRYFCDS